MTSRVRFALTVIAAGLFAGCASVPEDAPVVEKLDQETGLTIARLGRPVEVYRENLLKDPLGRFAFIGPFETNQMGTRETFLWISIPVELTEQDAPPVLEVNGQPLALGTPGRNPDFAGLMRSPYKIPTPWSAMFYYRADSALIGALGEASSITLRIAEPSRKGSVISTFSAQLEPGDTRLRDFAARQ
jgi:hypothetical protein